MLKLFNRNKGPITKEPSFSSAEEAWNDICSGDHKIIVDYLKTALYDSNAPLSFKELSEKSLGFISKERKNLYFTAMFKPLDEMVGEGSADIVYANKDDIKYFMTKQGRTAYENSTKDRAARSKRKDVDQEFQKFADSSAFLDSSKFVEGK